MEDPPRDAGDDNGSAAHLRGVRVCVHDLDRARRFWVDTLGLEVQTHVALYRQEHEALWHLQESVRTTLLLQSGETFIELVSYTQPRGKNRPAGYLLSDQGILNVALGTTDREVFDRLYARARNAGYISCYPPWTLPDVATVAYLEDGQGLTVELLCVDPRAMTRMGFAASGQPKAP